MSAHLAICSREAPAAKLFSLKRLRTERGSSEASFLSGRTSTAAVTRPVSGSAQKSAFSRVVLGAMPWVSLWQRMALAMASEAPRLRARSAPSRLWLVMSPSVSSTSMSCSRPASAHSASSSPSRRARARMTASVASMCFIRFSLSTFSLIESSASCRFMATLHG